MQRVGTVENSFVILFILLRLGPKIMLSIMLSLQTLVVLIWLPVTASQVLGYTALRDSSVVRS